MGTIRHGRLLSVLGKWVDELEEGQGRCEAASVFVRIEIDNPKLFRFIINRVESLI